PRRICNPTTLLFLKYPSNLVKFSLTCLLGLNRAFTQVLSFPVKYAVLNSHPSGKINCALGILSSIIQVLSFLSNELRISQITTRFLTKFGNLYPKTLKILS